METCAVSLPSAELINNMTKPANLQKGDKFVVVRDRNMNSLPNEVVEHCGIDSRHDLVEKDIFAIQQNGSRCILFWEDLAPYNDINYPYVGMKLINKQGEIRTVLGVCGLVAHLSYTDQQDALWNTIAIQELKKIFTTKHTSPTVTEYSMEEVAAALGKSVEEIKIKE